MEITGNCSVETPNGKELQVTCKIGEGEYQKHFLGLSDNVTYTVEQLENTDANPYKYKIIFRPEAIIPIEIEGGDWFGNFDRNEKSKCSKNV